MRYSIRFLFLLAILVMAGCSSVSFADVQSVDPVLKIGLVAPFEGERETGYDVLYAARLAVRQVNEAGGIAGHRVTLVAYDDNTYPPEARSVAEALIVDPGIVAVLGHWKPETNEAAGPMYDSAELAWVPMGTVGFGAYDTAGLPQEFLDAYYNTTPDFARQNAGLLSATTYDGMQLVFEAIELAAEDGVVSRQEIYQTLPEVTVSGMTGRISIPSSQ